MDYTGLKGSTPSMPMSMLLPLVFTTMYGVINAPSSAYILTLSLTNATWKYYQKYDVFCVNANWTRNKWYLKESYNITTYSGTVGGWRKLIKDVSPYIDAYGFVGIASGAAGVVSKAIRAAGGIAKIVSKASVIAAALGLSVEIIMAMIGGAKDKIQKETSGMQDNDWFMFNWRVDYHYVMFGAQPVNQTIYYYTPLALFY